jgi:hypothetical protein
VAPPRQQASEARVRSHSFVNRTRKGYKMMLLFAILHGRPDATEQESAGARATSRPRPGHSRQAANRGSTERQPTSLLDWHAQASSEVAVALGKPQNYVCRCETGPAYRPDRAGGPSRALHQNRA